MTSQKIADLLQPYIRSIAQPASGWSTIYDQLSVYLDLILKWNVRTNLTAIRTPDQIVRRHFGESLFAGSYLGECTTALDFGSGAGFPGVPVQLLRPDVRVTLGESRNKKAAFLRELCRELKLSTEVFAGRIETMPIDRRFDVVMLRAVDDMEAAIEESGRRTQNRLLKLTTASLTAACERLGDFQIAGRISLPESASGILEILERR